MGKEIESMETIDDFAADSSWKTSRVPRLFIKEMVMRNFKSYVGEQRVGPFHKEPRPVSRLDLERVLATTTRTNVAVTEYGILSPQSSGWPFRRGSSDYQVAAAGYNRQKAADHAINLAPKIRGNLTNSMKALSVDTQGPQKLKFRKGDFGMETRL